MNSSSFLDFIKLTAYVFLKVTLLIFFNSNFSKRHPRSNRFSMIRTVSVIGQQQPQPLFIAGNRSPPAQPFLMSGGRTPPPPQQLFISGGRSPPPPQQGLFISGGGRSPPAKQMMMTPLFSSTGPPIFDPMPAMSPLQPRYPQPGFMFGAAPQAHSYPGGQGGYRGMMLPPPTPHYHM
jgi:hypothetical protein